MNKDLRQYLKTVKSAGSDYYLEVKKRLKSELEVSVLQEKLETEGRFPVLYCPEIEGSNLPLVTNLIGNYDRWAVAFGIDSETYNKVGEASIFQEHKRRWHEAKPVKVVQSSEAPVKEIILRGKEADLNLLPITQHAELDSGKYITIGAMVCRDPDTGIPNVGAYRHELKGKNQLGCFIAPGNHGAYIAQRYAELGKPMEVVLFIGHHPMVILGACTRGTLNMNELEVMGGLLGEPLEVTPAETVDLPVPTWAEIAIEGVIDSSKMITDGPLAEYYGYYGEGEQPCYLIQVTGMTMRKDAIYHDLNNAHREHITWTVLPHESTAYDAVKKVVPSVQAVHIFPHTLGFRAAGVSIHQLHPGEAVVAGLAAIGEPEVKVAVVVDEDVDVYNEKELLWAVGTRAVADLDIHIIPRMLGAKLDPSAYDFNRLKRGVMVSKVVIDATKPMGQPFATRTTPPRKLWESMNLEDYLK